MFQDICYSILIFLGVFIVCPVLVYLFTRIGTSAYFDGKLRSIKKNLNGDKQCQEQEDAENDIE